MITPRASVPLKHRRMAESASVPADSVECTQMELLPLNPVNRVLGQSLEEQFDAFHGANPHVYSALRSLARELKRRGAKKAGIGQLFEVLRWQYALQTQGSEYRLNNNYRSFYARLLNQEPELRGMFETRTLRWQRHRR